MSTDSKSRFNRNPADTDLRFFSAVTASVTHELNNVLSIINQTGGLLEDLLYGVSQGEELKLEQLERIAEKISLQTQRGIDIIKRLNSFAHTCDNPVAEFDVYELTSGIVELSQRFADLCRVKLILNADQSRSVEVNNNPLKIQQVVFLILREIFIASNRDESIDVLCTARDDNAEIEVKHFYLAEPYQPDMTVIERIAGEISARIDLDDDGKVVRYKISIPV